MKSLLNKKFEIIALAPKVFRSEDTSSWSALLEMSGKVSMDHAPHSFLTIEQRNGDHLRKIASNIDTMSETSKVLVFHIALDRKLIATYVDRSREIVRKSFEEKASPTEIDFASALRRTKGVVFHGELLRDFELKTYTILMASHIADPLAVSVNRVVSLSGGDGATSERFKINLQNRSDCASVVALKKLSAKNVYDFLWGRPKEITGEPKSQFMKGVSYVSQIFRNSENPLIGFMWSLAAIEAMLSTSSDKANSGVLELRLRALLDGEKSDHVLGKFRDLYKYRNALFHGNVALPYSFDGRNLFGFHGVKHSNTMPYEIASFTHALALKILQRFFELGMYDVEYETSVAKK
ncbi:hypothetical protein [Mesorhizobium sp. ES1-1]|uniref:hypothetical protein n=1 Tax=Mesorhizobium sp. ES1-1 TaxID=2876629 RepID=UPI001CCCD92E|nr:hypothetical protein [Mesorhizobium sp. ES1-1]MBZ9675494.1 hypothetical protein [Mesorhizobium sp. ES1-1]